jgi:hypothetical protein
MARFCGGLHYKTARVILRLYGEGDCSEGAGDHFLVIVHRPDFDEVTAVPRFDQTP